MDLVPGLGPEDFQREATYLAHAFGALKCTVTVLVPGRVLLTFTTGDPLTAPIPAIPIPRHVDLAAVPVGVTENGQPWTLPAIGTHLLIAGATGAGKGSVLWSLLRGLAPEIASGRVVAWGIDPKGGMELAFGRNLFARLADSNLEDMALLLEDAVAVMDARTQRLKGVTRLHEPTPAEPLLLIVVDELASLTAYLNNRDVKKRVDAALQSLLTKGRAAGVTVVGALQDPRKEVVAYRDLFPTRVALRLTEKEQVGMVLGDSAWDSGAHCERIPATLPGVGYVHLDGQLEPVRVRASHVTDNDLHALNRDYPARPSTLDMPTPAPEVLDLRESRPRRRDLAAS